MCRYRVSFFRKLLSSDGHESKCLQQSIVIRRAKSINGPSKPPSVDMNASARWLTGGFTQTALSWRSTYNRVCIDKQARERCPCSIKSWS